MAERAATLLRESDEDEPYTVFNKAFVQKARDESPDRAALADFGFVRWLDAQRAAPEGIPRVNERPEQDEDPTSGSIGEIQYRRVELEKMSHDQLRRAQSALRSAIDSCTQGMGLGSRERAATGPVPRSADTRPDPRDAMNTALRCVEAAMAMMRQNVYRPPEPGVHDPFPSLWGLPFRQRKAALRRQARELLNAGCKGEDVASVLLLGMGTEGAATRRELLRKYLDTAD